MASVAQEMMMAKLSPGSRLTVSDKYSPFQDEDSDGASNPDSEGLLGRDMDAPLRSRRRVSRIVWSVLKAAGLLALFSMSIGFLVCVFHGSTYFRNHKNHEQQQQQHQGHQNHDVGSATNSGSYFDIDTTTPGSYGDHTNHHVDLSPKVMHDLAPIASPCGNTTASARAAGCIFDIISFSWLPERCYDAYLANEFAARKTWQWYKDVDRNEEVAHDEALTGEYPVLYVDWGYHIVHCTYMWRKMHRALEGPYGVAAIDGYIGSIKHTEHCGHMLLSNRDTPLDKMNTGIRVKYPGCGLLT